MKRKLALFFAMGLALLSVGSVAPEPDARDRLSIATAAKKYIGVTTNYTPAYQKILYPGGDIPAKDGVCTDVIIRAFRKLGIDLQKLVHEDMKKNWDKYPKLWGLNKPDSNIDHRRVPNLMTFFKSITTSELESDFKPSDIVVWDLGNGVLHIGVVSDRKSKANYLVVHNICCGVKEDDILHTYTKVARFRFADSDLKTLQGRGSTFVDKPQP